MEFVRFEDVDHLMPSRPACADIPPGFPAIVKVLFQTVQASSPGSRFITSRQVEGERDELVILHWRSVVTAQMVQQGIQRRFTTKVQVGGDGTGGETGVGHLAQVRLR